MVKLWGPIVLRGLILLPMDKISISCPLFASSIAYLSTMRVEPLMLG